MYLGCNHLSVRFYQHRKKIVDDITLSIHPGEKLLILGPSGCGKSTLISALSGIIPEFLDAEVTGEVVRRERAGVMFQDPDSQFCMLHVDEEIAFSLENRRIPRGKMDEMISDVMDKAGLNIDKRTSIESLSGGMKQRLALACILALDPEVLFFDEPTAQLDPQGRIEIFELLKNLSRQTGQTMVFVEHVLDGCIEWMDRVILLNKDGRMIGSGKPEEVLREFDAEIKEAGIWRPKLFPVKWNDVVENHDHPVSAELTRFIETRSEEHRFVGGNPMIRVEDATIGYGKKAIVQDLNLTIHKGEWISIVGKNGSGKSTFLKSLARLESLRKGKIYFLEKELSKWPDVELYEKAGFVFQNPELQFIADMVFEEIAFGGRQRNWTEEQIQEKTHQLLREFGLEAHRDAHPFTLSLGQKRRLSVATMLLFDQDVLLLDEPTFGQDEKTAKELIKKLKERQAQGTTIIMVTHDMNLVDQCSDKVLLLKNGKAAYYGTPYSLFMNEVLLEDSSLVPPLHYKLVHARKELSLV